MTSGGSGGTAAVTAAGYDPPQPGRAGRVLVVITEDWFCLSHFQPLLRLLAGELAREVVVAARPSGREGEITRLGARFLAFDLKRSSINPVGQALTVGRLARLIRTTAPDVVHVIAMQPMVLASLAMRLLRVQPAVVLHLTGLGFLGISESRAAALIRPAALRALAATLRRPASWLLAENPEDLDYLIAGGADPGPRRTILGGAGLEPAEWPEQPLAAKAIPVAAFVGRMIRSKGVEHLVAAHDLLAGRGVGLSLALYGRIDPDNPEALPKALVEAWARRPGIAWHGHVSNVAEVWRTADIAVLPAITREGMPRAVLEAAASGRALIVTDVPGCRHFVRDGVEGFVVPAADPAALATALERLVVDPGLCRRMGQAARRRFLDGYTVGHVMAGVREAYGGLGFGAG